VGLAGAVQPQLLPAELERLVKETTAEQGALRRHFQRAAVAAQAQSAQMLLLLVAVTAASA